MFWCVVSLYIFTRCLYFDSPYGLVKHGTNGGYCIYSPSNIFRNTCGFENWGYHPDILQF